MIFKYNGMKLFFLFVGYTFCLLQISNADAAIKINSLFSDHVVLQQGKPIPVWGTANEGEKITVKFNGQSLSTTTVNGKWLVKLAAMPCLLSGAEMIVSSATETIIVNDMLIGEVWLCSGQSNMERQLGPRPPQQPINNWEKERDSAKYSFIRQYYVPLNYSPIKIEDVNNKWTVCSPQTVADFTAVGYFFAKNLYEKRHVPIGIIFSAFGGTPAEDWISKEALTANPELADFVNDYKQKISADYQPAGQLMSGLFNGMINPLLPYAIKGVAWYQGEANNERTKQYPEVLKTMVANWRADFQQDDFPFLIVQIAPHKDMRPELREAQLIATQTIKNTALIVTTDCGDADDIHPPNKQSVGERLAIAARAVAYKEKIVYEGPVYQSFKQKRNKIIIRFAHTGNKLMSKDNAPLTGFTIAAADKKFIPATAVIKKRKVIVYSNAVKNPVAVRYGWANVPDVNLYNSEGLPASPFRTDIN